MGQTVFIEVCLNNIAEIGVSGEVFAHLFFTKTYNFLYKLLCMNYDGIYTKTKKSIRDSIFEYEIRNIMRFGKRDLCTRFNIYIN